MRSASCNSHRGHHFCAKRMTEQPCVYLTRVLCCCRESLCPISLTLVSGASKAATDCVHHHHYDRDSDKAWQAQLRADRRAGKFLFWQPFQLIEGHSSQPSAIT
ncbi:hypothetical protein C8Q70DRAFT_946054 [Cubamyces menziesii]|nr:hypothetical protein C8Q70DRAFT_946054 [Cubamyces menziesii]